MDHGKFQVERIELLKRIEACEDDAAEFTKLMAAALIIASVAGRRDEFWQWMASRCRTAKGTVSRWATGVASPPRIARKCILAEAADFFREPSK